MGAALKLAGLCAAGRGAAWRAGGEAPACRAVRCCRPACFAESGYASGGSPGSNDTTVAWSKHTLRYSMHFCSRGRSEQQHERCHGGGGSSGRRAAAAAAGWQKGWEVCTAHLPPSGAVLGLAPAPRSCKRVRQVKDPLCALPLLLPRNPAERQQRCERQPRAKPRNGLHSANHRAPAGRLRALARPCLEIWHARHSDTLYGRLQCTQPRPPGMPPAPQRAARRDGWGRSGFWPMLLAHVWRGADLGGQLADARKETAACYQATWQTRLTACLTKLAVGRRPK